MKEILLIDADTKKGFANLALMKLSAWHKENGNHVELIKGIPSTSPLKDYDRIYISCVFYQNKERVLNYARQFDDSKVVLGGSGIDLAVQLDNDIEHLMPDYDLYDFPHSMGFTSRGCIRKCQWCVVPEKEGMIRNNAPISEFMGPRHDSVILLDNNFQSSPRWMENLHYLLDNSLKVNFNQGLDIRLVNEDFARCLSVVKYYDWNFKSRRLHFAFDTMAVEPAIERGLKILNDVGIGSHRLMFYILIGFNTTLEQDLYRVKKVVEWGALPYIMRYNKNKDQKLIDLTRWVNRRYYKFLDFKDYDTKIRDPWKHRKKPVEDKKK